MRRGVYITAYKVLAKAEGLNGASFEEGPLLLRGQSALLEQIYDCQGRNSDQNRSETRT